MATGKREMSAAEAALVGKWGVFRTRWSNPSIGKIERFTEQRVYTARPYNPTPRERTDLLAAFETEVEAGKSAAAYEKAHRAAAAEVSAAQDALRTARTKQTLDAEIAAVVGSLPVP
ncbi:hypothetical protein [Methylobacterium fujisawaense]